MSMQRCCPPAEVVSDSFEEEAALFKALGDAHRLRMLAALARAPEEACVCDFTDALPLNQPTVSQHLRLRREAQLITCERRGTWVYYQLAPDAPARIKAATSSLLKRKVRL